MSIDIRARRHGLLRVYRGQMALGALALLVVGALSLSREPQPWFVGFSFGLGIEACFQALATHAFLSKATRGRELMRGACGLNVIKGIVPLIGVPFLFLDRSPNPAELAVTGAVLVLALLWLGLWGGLFRALRAPDRIARQ